MECSFRRRRKRSGVDFALTRRAAWAAYTNRALEAAGRRSRIDHRSYKRQGVDKIPSVHMGSAAGQMERRGIATVKGNINREIAADNKLLKEIKARITRLYNWSKEQSGQPQGKESIMDFLFQARQDIAPASQYARVKALKKMSLFSISCKQTVFRPCRNFTKRFPP